MRAELVDEIRKSKLKAAAKCACGKADVELWFPGTVRCPVCLSVYLWQPVPQCITEGECFGKILGVGIRG